jgi:hypothetical protein
MRGNRQIDVAEPGHAHQARHSVDLGGARSALARLAVPARGEVRRALGLDLMNGVEDDHPLPDVGLEIDELRFFDVAA